MARKLCLLAFVSLALLPAAAFAQQTGNVSGRVIDSGGLVLPGVTVEAKSESLPTPRVTVTGGAGEYRLPALQPGTYTLTFTLSGMNTATKQVMVQLAQDTTVDATMNVQGVSETVTVTAEIIPAIEKDSTALKSSVATDAIQSVPVGQEYRDLVKLIPGVQYTQDAIRGPSAGGSGQDNVYKFDGVNVTLPLFGTLATEPSSHDIAQVTTIKGGSKAVDFDRSGGFTVDSVSKSGTSKFSGMLSYQIQSDAMAAALTSGSLSQYEQDRAWATANIGGPILQNKAYFYASYYRPTRSRANASNVYGPLPGYESVRNEGFGKVTLTPISQVLLNISWRQSHRLDTGSTFGSTSTATTGSGGESWQKIGIVEGSWVVNSRSFVAFKYTHFANPGQTRPDYTANVTPTTALGTQLDINNLDKAGSASIPTPVSGQTAYNAFIQPIIDKYGYVNSAGVKTGGGTVGYYYQFDEDNFYRDAAQVAYNITLGSGIQHDIHAGLQWYVDSEDLIRSSNGWGSITVPGGRLASAGVNGVNAYYQATFQQMSTGAVPPIHSEYRSTNIEVNDTIKVNDFSFNVGLLMSHDKLYGQGLQNDSSTISGFSKAAVGTQYLMYTIPAGKTLQPRIGATWAYNGKDTVYASFARYVPAASSLPRAASWARSLTGLNINAFFDQNGVLYGSTAVGSSTGKMFQPDLTPRRTDEYLIGTARQFSHGVTGRLYYRYRRGSHFWEDTNNDARIAYNPPEGIPSVLYIPNVVDQMKQLGATTATNNNTYVIAELDGAYTTFHEVTAEAEWRTRKSYVRASYSWNRYRGNFDQDNTTVANDANSFIGSSNIGDGAGRQLWNFKDGILRGDRPMSFKLYGYYQLPWWASVGAYGIVQSGQPWEKWNYEPYIALTTSVNESDRYAEPAGSRRTDTHYQLDLNYTQDLRLATRYRFQVIADLFNVFNKQTGYNIEARTHQATFGIPRNYFDPRRLQVSVRFQF
jgi:hypothetical protein